MGRSQNHHSIPRAYLRGWSLDGESVQAYRLLVPVEKYPEWERRRIGSLTAYADLYTSTAAGEPSDDFERWINEEFESPAHQVLEKVRNAAVLRSDDWRALALYVAAMHVRTPAFYLQSMKLWEEKMPALLKGVLTSAVRAMERKKVPRAKQPDGGPPSAQLPVRGTIERGAPGQGGTLRAEVTMGRQLWLHSMRHLLTNTAPILTRHHWQIFRPADRHAWFTTDDPVLRLAYRSEREYHFNAGWAAKNAEIVLPLSPSHLLYTKIGQRGGAREVQLTPEMTGVFQRMIAQHAHRWIFAADPSTRATWFRPRSVNLAMFRHEEAQWRDWHKMQSEDPEAGPIR